MDTEHHAHVTDTEEYERKAGDLFSLLLALCEEKIAAVSKPDAHAASLAHAVMAVQNAMRTFLNLARIR